MLVGQGYNNAEATCLNNHTQHGNDVRGLPTQPLALDSSADLEKSDPAEISSRTTPLASSDGVNSDQLARHPSAASTLEYPDGGLQAWLVVFGSFCAMVSVFGLTQTAAIFQSYFSTHQLAGRSASDIGWIFSLYLFIVFFVGIQVAPIFDVYGPRLLVLCGSLLITLSMLLLGFCTGEQLLFILVSRSPG